MKTKLIILLTVVLVFTGIVVVIIEATATSSRERWKQNYLEKLYPLAKPEELTDAFYDSLEVLFVKLLPSHEVQKLKKTAYKAILPGPSCGQLPCPCLDKTEQCTGQPEKKFNLPTVHFSPNPVLGTKWPPCNLPGEAGKKCCQSTDAYMKCMSDGTFEKMNVSWANGDTWDGNSENENQPPPAKGQVFSPALWPDYTLAVSPYDSKNWNTSLPAAGSSSGYIEGLHSAFIAASGLPGIWFYNAKGSGIFISLDTSKDKSKRKDFVALNKIHALELLFHEMFPDKDPYMELANFIIRADAGDIILDNSNCAGWLSDVSGTKDLTVSTTGMGGDVQYWLNGQNRKMIKETISPLTPEKLATYLKDVTYGKDYNTNRFANTGSLDNLIVYLARNLGYTALQFTVQPNLYCGWAAEVILMGPPLAENKKMFTVLDDVKHLMTIRDPMNLADYKKCTRSTLVPWSSSRCLHCDELPAVNETCNVDLSATFTSCVNYC